MVRRQCVSGSEVGFSGRGEALRLICCVRDWNKKAPIAVRKGPQNNRETSPSRVFGTRNPNTCLWCGYVRASNWKDPGPDTKSPTNENPEHFTNVEVPRNHFPLDGIRHRVSRLSGLSLILLLSPLFRYPPRSTPIFPCSLGKIPNFWIGRDRVLTGLSCSALSSLSKLVLVPGRLGTYHLAFGLGLQMDGYGRGALTPTSLSINSDIASPLRCRESGIEDRRFAHDGWMEPWYGSTSNLRPLLNSWVARGADCYICPARFIHVEAFGLALGAVSL